MPRLKPLVLFAFVALTIAFSSTGFAQEGEVFTSPDSSFTVAIVEGWAAETLDAGAAFTSPEGITLYWLALPGDDGQVATATAIDLFSPDFEGQPVQETSLPAPQGIWEQVIYLEGINLAASLTLVSNGMAYALWAPPMSQADLAAISPALNTMLLSFTPAGSRDVSDAQSSPLTEADLNDLSAYVEAALATFEIPGASVAIVQQGQVVFTGAYGLANTADDTAVNENTLFMIGSSTKSMTSWVAASLVDDGLFTWDTPISDLLPTFTLVEPDQADVLAVRHFFNMASGLPRYDLSMFLKMRTPDELLGEVATIPVVAEPGEAFNYNNQMVGLGGFAVAAYASGAPLSQGPQAYAELLQTRIFTPLGMTNSTVDFDAAINSGRAATSYYHDSFAGEVFPVDSLYERFVIPVAPAGAVWSTGGDMGRYLAAQMRGGVAEDGTILVSAENLGVTKTAAISISGTTGYGLGWMTGDWYGQALLEHGGATNGFTSTMAYLPDAQIGVIVLTNTAGGHFGNAVRDYAFELAFGLEHSNEAIYVAARESEMQLSATLVLQAQASDTPPDAEELEPYLGEYDLGIAFALDQEGQLRVTGPFPSISLLRSGPSGTRFVTTGVLGGLFVEFSQRDGRASVSLTNPLSALAEGEADLVLYRN